MCIRDSGGATAVGPRFYLNADRQLLSRAMSVIVEPTDISDHVGGRTSGFVMSVGASGQVKVMHAAVELGEGATMRVELGPGGIRNTNERPSVTMLWPDVSEGFSLLADATAQTAEVPEQGRGWVVLDVDAAVLHKAPGSATP